MSIAANRAPEAQRKAHNVAPTKTMLKEVLRDLVNTWGVYAILTHLADAVLQRKVVGPANDRIAKSVAASILRARDAV